jgi:multicomponent Na+:H+ antiporter subunit D
MIGVPPAFVLLAAALLLPFLSLGLRRAATVAAPLLALPLMLALPEGSSWIASGGPFELVWARSDALSRIFGIVFLLAAFAAAVYGWRRDRLGEQLGGLVYVAGGLAVVFAGDLVTMLFAWEVTAVSSTVLIASGGRRASVAAAQRYLIVHVAGGGAMLVGILMVGAAQGSLAFGELGGLGTGAWLILVAFCLNAAVPPLHAWLPDAYPEATPSGSVLLSAFTTKAAVYCLLRGFPGEEALLWIGAVMAVYGVAFAVLENDIRRLLGYHIVSQVGYMVCGIGIGTALALNGAVAHAFCHILYKGLLFMGAGAMLQVTGTQKLTGLGGLARATPWTFAFYMVGALSISGLPLFNGFVSKSMIVAGAGEAHLGGVFLLLQLASVGTFLSVGLKLPYYAWFARPPRISPPEAPAPMLAGMAFLSLLCIGLGAMPGPLYAILPYEAAYDPFTAAHVFETLLLTAATAAAFWWLRARLVPHDAMTLDFDWLYRRPAAVFVARVSAPLYGLYVGLGAAVREAVGIVVRASRNPTLLAPRLFRGEGLDGMPAYDENRQRQSVGSIVLWVLTVFCLAGFSFLAAAR